MYYCLCLQLRQVGFLFFFFFVNLMRALIFPWRRGQQTRAFPVCSNALCICRHESSDKQLMYFKEGGHYNHGIQQDHILSYLFCLITWITQAYLKRRCISVVCVKTKNSSKIPHTLKSEETCIRSCTDGNLEQTY